MSDPLRPSTADCLAGVTALIPDDDGGAKDYPILSDLFRPRYDDKGRMTREGAFLSIRPEGTCYQVTVSCPTEAVQTTMRLTSLVDMLEKVEAYLHNGCEWAPDWRTRKKAREALDTARRTR